MVRNEESAKVGASVSDSPEETMAWRVVGALRDDIVTMALKPGDVISESDIAGRYGVSRQPVREAFIKLSEAGLVEIRPSRGTFVMKISVREVANARFVREAIEANIAREAARLAGAADTARLRALVAAQRTAAAADDYWSFNEHDEAFHRAIADIVQCDYAWRVVESARIQTDRVRYLSLPDASPMPLLISQHEQVVERLEARDADGAEAAMRRHLREILVALQRIATAHPDLFDDTDLPAHTMGPGLPE
jgi:DNA-binding GntR family transcriptional regulator